VARIGRYFALKYHNLLLFCVTRRYWASLGQWLASPRWAFRSCAHESRQTPLGSSDWLARRNKSNRGRRRYRRYSLSAKDGFLRYGKSSLDFCIPKALRERPCEGRSTVTRRASEESLAYASGYYEDIPCRGNNSPDCKRPTGRPGWWRLHVQQRKLNCQRTGKSHSSTGRHASQ
jgi:hypothetical protein